MEEAGRWCPRCGAEYLPYVERCADCQEPLADDPPAPADHGIKVFDLAGWDQERCQGLELRLTGAGIPFGWEGGQLVVPRTAAETVAELMEEIPQLLPSDEPEWDQPRAEGPSATAALASIPRRIGARLIDGVILGIPSSVAFFMAAEDFGTAEAQRAWWALTLLDLVYETAGIAIWGQTAGKRLLRIRVVGADGALPGWGRSLRRWAVPFGLGLVPYVGWLLATAAVLRAMLAPTRQGLHDLAAGTFVVDATPSQPPRLLR